MGTLYLVATPIGNLEDISPRAIRILREVILIAAEDTRHTGTLLKHFDIKTPSTSYFEHNKLSKLDYVLEKLSGGDVALVSDAGMPAINDPGYELVKAALASGWDVRPVPGPSAPITALAASGLPTDSFIYLGYLPHKSSERCKAVGQIENLSCTLIFFESPHRIVESLKDILSTIGDRRICIAREMTKMFEEYWRGNISGALEHFKSQPARGEFTLVIEGKRKDENEKWTEGELLEAIQKGLTARETLGKLAGRLAKESGWERRDIYKIADASRE